MATRRIRHLIDRLAAAEAELVEAVFLAPRVVGGKVRAKVQGLVVEYRAEPAEFEGWGIFQVVGDRLARLIESATLPQVGAYLQLLPQCRFFLAHPLRGRSWMAYPMSEGDAIQRWGGARPVVLHLVTEGARFEQVVGRRDGGAWWFEAVDRRADPRIAERLDTALRSVVAPGELHFAGLTPEMRTVYDLAAQREEQFRELLRARRAADRENRRELAERRALERGEARLDEALELAGGKLVRTRDRGEHWLVEWTTADGQTHHSAIEKGDLTVISSGICLSGQDRDFDLQSLVGVMEGNYD